MWRSPVTPVAVRIENADGTEAVAAIKFTGKPGVSDTFNWQCYDAAALIIEMLS